MSATHEENGEHDKFVHDIAIKLSRALNLINPNDLLARRVIDIAKNNTPSKFLQGELYCYMSSLLKLFSLKELFSLFHSC